MPIYTYECDTCGYRFDDMAPMDSVPYRPCEQQTVQGPLPAGLRQCSGTAKRIPSLPAPAQFNCSMPTYQKKKT